MEYQININYQFTAESEQEANDKAQSYISSNMAIKQLNNSVISPLQVAKACKSFRNKKKEHFCVFFLDTQNRIIGKEIVSVGILNSSIVHPRECFRTAILKNSCSVIFVHNHPSHSLEPSMEDIIVTKRLIEVGKLIGIEVLDHVIVTKDSHTSLKESHFI